MVGGRENKSTTDQTVLRGGDRDRDVRGHARRVRAIGGWGCCPASPAVLGGALPRGARRVSDRILEQRVAEGAPPPVALMERAQLGRRRERHAPAGAGEQAGRQAADAGRRGPAVVSFDSES